MSRLAYFGGLACGIFGVIYTLIGIDPEGPNLMRFALFMLMIAVYLRIGEE